MLNQKVALNTKTILIFFGIFLVLIAVFAGVYFLFIEKSLDPRGRADDDDEECYPHPGPQGTLLCEEIDHETFKLTYSYTEAYTTQCSTSQEGIRIVEGADHQNNPTKKWPLQAGTHSGTIEVKASEIPKALNEPYLFRLVIGTTPYYRPLAEALNCKAKEPPPPDPECGDLARTYTPTEITWPEGEFCSEGDPDPETPTFPPNGEETTWECSVGEESVTCEATRDEKTPPACGDLAKPYEPTDTNWPTTGDFCTEGSPNPASPIFPEAGTTTTWDCIDGDDTQKCSAPRGATPTPPAPELPETGLVPNTFIFLGMAISILGLLIYMGKIHFLDTFLFKILNLNLVKKGVMSKSEYFEEKILEKEEN